MQLVAIHIEGPAAVYNRLEGTLRRQRSAADKRHFREARGKQKEKNKSGGCPVLCLRLQLKRVLCGMVEDNTPG